MARVLLVDDDRNVRKGLAAIIARSGTAFGEIEECSNGSDALRLMSARRYDLLITDVLMPEMDGIELVARMDGMAEKPYVVILSGHDDFKYAQKAIGCGVKAYLLKPVNREELRRALVKAEAELSTGRNGAGVEALFENRLRLFLLGGGLPPAEAGGEPEGLPELPGRRCVVAALNAGDVYESADKRENNAALVSLVRQRAAEMRAEAFCFLDHRGNAVAVLDESADIGVLAGPPEEIGGCAVTAGIGRPFEGYAGMRRSYLEADYALRYRLLDPSRRVVRHADLPCADDRYVLPVRQLRAAVGLLDADRKEELCRLVGQLFDEAALRRYRLDYAEKLSQAFKNEIVEYLSECMPHKVEFIREQESSFRGIYEFRSVRDYIHYARGYVININNALLRTRSGCSTNGEIDRAIRYIKDNYRKDLTMAEVANAICLNYSYFSLLFKGKTGMNFVDYLKAMRIEKAKELLKNTEYKIYEISEMVGYNNTKHFTTMFRSFTGISPREFRDKVYLAN